MKKYLQLILVLFTLQCCTANQNDKNIVEITLETKNKQEAIKVNIEYPKTDSDTLFFKFPKTVPGTYHELDSNLFISEIKAIDINGNNLEITEAGERKYRITGTKSLKKISYNIKGSEITTKGFLATGVIIKDSICVLNNQNLIGYIEKFKDTKHIIHLKKKSGFNCIPSSKTVEENDITADIEFLNYPELIDNPIIYTANHSPTDTVINNRKISISSYAPKGKINSNDITKIIAPTIDAVFKEIDFLPIKEYNLFFFFNSDINTELYDFSALEHNSSSNYILFSEPNFKNFNDSIDFAKKIKLLVAHEIFHLFTPLSYREECLDNFNYYDYDKISHLWLYEGFVEYYSRMILLKHSIISQQDFLESIEKSIDKYTPYEKMQYKFSLQETSENIYNKPGHLRFFYSRGAVLAFMLDIEIISETKGKSDLYKVLKSMYSSNKTFNNDTLYKLIENETNYSITEFLNTHVIKDTYVNKNKYLAKAGLIYSKSHKDLGYYFPVKIKEYSNIDNWVEIEFKKPISGINNKIKLKAINNMKIDSYSLSLLYKRYYTPKPLKVKYFYNNKELNTEIKPIKISVPRVPFYPTISIEKNMTASQKLIYSKLFKK